MNLIFSLNNLNGRTDNFLGSPAGWEGQKVLEHRARISTHLANYSRGKGSNSKDGLSLCGITNITNASCGITSLIASLYKLPWWLAWIKNQTGISHVTTKRANSTGSYIKRNIVCQANEAILLSCLGLENLQLGYCILLGIEYRIRGFMREHWRNWSGLSQRKGRSSRTALNMCTVCLKERTVKSSHQLKRLSRQQRSGLDVRNTFLKV